MILKAKLFYSTRKNQIRFQSSIELSHIYTNKIAAREFWFLLLPLTAQCNAQHSNKYLGTYGEINKYVGSYLNHNTLVSIERSVTKTDHIFLSLYLVAVGSGILTIDHTEPNLALNIDNLPSCLTLYAYTQGTTLQ